MLPFLLSSAASADLPQGFVRLADVEPTIRQDIRYAGSANFLGRRAAGYDAPACILTREAAEALAAAQARLVRQHLTLVVLDCYRPQRAVKDFLRWAAKPGPADPRWHPETRREKLVAEGYIGRRSAHSRGSTVDVALAPLNGLGAPDPDCGATQTGSLDFGTGFDCFASRSATASKAVGAQARTNRRLLTEAMRAAGFRNYPREWWHFTLAGEPFPDRRFDFPVTAGP